MTFALIASIAACSKSDPVAKGANAVTALPLPANQAAPSPAGAPPENGAAPSASAASTSALPIPPALQGRWGLTPADCTAPLANAKGLLVINTNELRFYESRGVPLNDVQSSPQALNGRFGFSGEGKSWTRYEALKRNRDKLTRTETNPAASYTYAKC
ncbi:MAG TPA: hypothetical protein VFW35_02005 [Sphingomicrobium sp.]|nr:hypothetical protein [Sphingomicrobium sp.]